MRSRKPANDLSPIIAVAGGIFMDLVLHTDRVPERGESLDAKSLACVPSGKGLHTALAIYRAQRYRTLIDLENEDPKRIASTRSHAKSRIQEPEVRVRLNAAIGDEQHGSELRDNLRQNGLDDLGVRTIPGRPTGTCVKLVERNEIGSRDTRFPGANSYWSPPAPNTLVVLESLAGGRKPDLIVCNFEVKMDRALSLLENAAAEGIETVLNPSPAPALGFDDSVYQNVTHLVLDIVEASKLLQKAPEELGEDPLWASHFGLLELKYWKRAVNFFLEKGVQNIVILVEAKGAFYACGESRGFVEVEIDSKAKATAVAA